jgi:hypothetical protein
MLAGSAGDGRNEFSVKNDIVCVLDISTAIPCKNARPFLGFSLKIRDPSINTFFDSLFARRTAEAGSEDGCIELSTRDRRDETNSRTLSKQMLW